MKQIKDKYFLMVLVLAFLVIAIPRLRFPDLDHGDEYSDANVLNAGENFVKFGFLKCRFLPMFEVHLDEPQGLYTHYPPLPDIANGVERKVFQTDSLYVFRSVSLIFSLFALFFWFFAVKMFTGSNVLGFFASLFYLFNPLFLFGIDSLHQFAYAEFLRSLIFYLFARFIFRPEKRKIGLILLWLAIFFESLFTFEYIIYFYLFFFLYWLVFKEARRVLSFKIMFLLALAPVAGFLLHFVQNLWYFGSVSLVVDDLKKVAIERIAQSKDTSMKLDFVVWWKYVIARNFSLVLLFNYFILSLFSVLLWLLYRPLSRDAKKKIKPLFFLCLITAACGITWYIFFPSHSVAHTFLIFMSRHLLSFGALAFTLFSYIVYVFIRENNPKNIPGKMALGIIILLILLRGLGQSDIPLGSEKVARARDFQVFKSCLLTLKERSREKDEIAINYFRNPFVRYYTHRRSLAIFNKPALEQLPFLPRYFIFMPYNDPQVIELYEFLKENYVLLFQCQSARFPTLFFEKKG